MKLQRWEQGEFGAYECSDGDWVKWDDAQELLEALKEIRDVTDARSRWSIACAAIAKFEGTKQ